MSIDKTWPEPKAIAAAHGTDSTDFDTPELNRSWSNFDLSQCDHVGTIRVVGQLGPWMIVLCAECGKTLSTECDHREYHADMPEFSTNVSVNHVEWNAEGTMLRCKVCGVDAT